MTDSPQTTQVQVDKTRIAEEIGKSPNTQADRYPADTHVNNSLRMYNAPAHEVAGAIEWAKQQDKRLVNRVNYSVDEVAGWLKQFLKQEHQGYKAAMEARNP